jgi:site-specific recombinase XerD
MQATRRPAADLQGHVLPSKGTLTIASINIFFSGRDFIHTVGSTAKRRSLAWAVQKNSDSSRRRRKSAYKAIGERAGLSFPVHAHMPRRACGYALANAGHDTRRIQDWLGHRSIKHTVRYSELTAAPFKDFWR